MLLPQLKYASQFNFCNQMILSALSHILLGVSKHTDRTVRSISADLWPYLGTRTDNRSLQGTLHKPRSLDRVLFGH